jgi:chromosome segregation ATPase
VRFLPVVLLALSRLTFAQNTEPDQRIQQTLISEIQQLRLAIERSTLLNARTQLAVSQLQLQETSVARLTQQLNDLRMSAPAIARRRTEAEEQIKRIEQLPPGRPEYEQVKDVIPHLKLELEEATATEQQRSAREGELASQLQAVQNQIADSRSRIAEMERALDAAIQQLLKPH